MPRVSKKLIVVAVIALIIILVAITLASAKGTVTVKIDGGADPITTTVLLDDVILEPAGKDGSEYVAKVSTGNHALKITSPYIKTTTEDITVAPFSKKNITKTVQEISPDELAKTIIGEKVESATRSRMFENTWLVTYVTGSKTPNKDGATSFVLFFHFETNSGEWIPVTPETVALIESAPIEARSYYESFSED